ncbi:uncharacterized protein [Panulirus ornatus]|uniref:uncharacterized protein isoform X2 n=1 Tax=Panulirus ornatus TaxID=150431 RepID=UPI003A847C3B
MSQPKDHLLDNACAHPVTPRRQYAADVTARVQNRDAVEEHRTREEMTSLHKQLQEEAENIVRWKANSEIKAKNLERQLQETRNIIDDQRHNLMDLQLHSEHLSQSLLKEHQERELISAKVNHTRQLFLALQDQYEHLLDSSMFFQQDKDFLSAEHSEMIKKLTNLHEQSVAYQESIQQFKAKTQENFYHLEKQKELLEQQMSVKDHEVISLNEKLLHHQETVKDLLETLRTTEASLASIQNEKIVLGSQLDEVKTSLVKAQDELQEQTASLTDHAHRVEKDLKLEQIRLVESQKEFQEAVEKIQYLKKNNDILEGSKSELTEKVAALNTRKQELEEVVACKAEEFQLLEAAQHTLIAEVSRLQQSNANISTKLNSLEIEYKKVEVEKEQLFTELEANKKYLDDEKQLVKRLEEQVTSLKVDVERYEQLQIQLKEEQKIEKEHSQEKDDCLRQLREKLMEKDEIIVAQEKRISSVEDHSVSFKQKFTELEEKLAVASCNLEAKEKECDDLAASFKQLKTEVKKLDKELKLKARKLLTESKVKNRLEKKIIGLERQLQNSIEEAQSFENERKMQEDLLTSVQNTSFAQEEQLNDSLKTVQELKLANDESLYEQQKLQNKLDATVEEFQSYQTLMKSDLERLQNAVNQKEEELKSSVISHEWELDKLRNELEETKELNKSVSVHERELQDHIESLKKELSQIQSVHKEEIVILKNEMENVIHEQKQAKEEADVAIKESVQAKLESDGKEMVDLLNRYKNDKEAKLKEVEQQLQNSQTQVKQLISEKANLMSEISTLKSDAEELRMKILSLPSKNEETPELNVNDVTFKTPSPAEYLQSASTLAEPQILESACMPKVTEINPSQIQQPVTSILKTGRRTLLPPEHQKHVVFMTPSVPGETHSGESSSDAYTFEIADSDDPFEEIKWSGRYLPNCRSGKIFRANIASISHTTNVSDPVVSQTTSMIDQHTNPSFIRGQKNKWQKGGSQEKKKMKLDHHRQQFKTYSPLRPKQRQTEKNNLSVPLLTSYLRKTPTELGVKKEWLD